MNKTLKITLIIGSVGLALPFLIFNHSMATDKSSRLNIESRAEELASFVQGELIPKPEVLYLMPGELGEQVNIFSKDKKVINFFSPGEYMPVIQVVYKAPEFTISDSKKKTECASFKNTITDVLANCGVELADEDMVSPSRDSQPVTQEIKITRVNIAQLEKTQDISFSTKEIDDNTLERGKTKVESVGKVGTRKLTYQVRREDGVEVSRTLIKDEIIEKPENRIVKIGTKVVVISSVRGYATATNLGNAVVSANYKRGTVLRITNQANGVSIIKTVNYTWGTAKAPEGIVLDLSWSILSELKFNGSGKGPVVLVEELKN